MDGRYKELNQETKSQSKPAKLPTTTAMLLGIIIAPAASIGSNIAAVLTTKINIQP